MRQTDVIPEATQTAKKQLAAGDISGAERLLFQQLQLTPNDRETHYYYCVCLRYLARLSDAQGELETLLTRFPRFARGYQEIGYTFKALNEPDKALSSFRTAVTLNDALAWQLAGTNRADQHNALHPASHDEAYDPGAEPRRLAQSPLASSRLD